MDGAQSQLCVHMDSLTHSGHDVSGMRIVINKPSLCSWDSGKCWCTVNAMLHKLWYQTFRVDPGPLSVIKARCQEDTWPVPEACHTNSVPVEHASRACILISTDCSALSPSSTQVDTDLSDFIEALKAVDRVTLEPETLVEAETASTTQVGQVFV